MDRFLLVSIWIVASISSISADEGPQCTLDNLGIFEVCVDSEVITSVNQKQDSQSLSLIVANVSAIAPYAFREVKIHKLKLWGNLNSWNCTPKVINVTPESFEGLSDITSLELKCLEFPVELNPFKHLEALEDLRLTGVDFSKLGDEFFADFPNLNVLKLIDSKITIITPKTFSKIPEQLKQLWIIRGVSAIEPKSFERFRNLKGLGLHEGQLASLSSGILHGLHQLEHLNLQKNGIQEIAADAFSGLPSLKTLYLTSNQIKELEPFTFAGLNVHHLALSYNQLEHLTTGVFQNLRHLSYLDLDFNHITNIDSQSFEDCPKLAMLNLDSNIIQHIEPRAFSGLNLHTLDLTDNNISVLGSDTFAGLRVGEILDLRNNNITEIKPQAFRNLIARWVALCYINEAEVDRDSWGVGNSIQMLAIDRCGHV
ncbi:insulin-like growth factor-binding protein complex acid labile subunit [Diachasma alloeum]|uniref:insulin-like growth factor-binding protein complex acid labile subunit n=1 Tax=Diachasma alloeum TaxID=454923 RepID=UPI0007383CD0|nr:insulin-like growth factor-binding protein complex acid labile subunit [Diachasma alloeum]